MTGNFKTNYKGNSQIPSAGFYVKNKLLILSGKQQIVYLYKAEANEQIPVNNESLDNNERV